MVDIWPIYQGDHCRFVINFLLRAQDIQFGLQVACMLTGMIALIITGCESCVVESCLPEFKGTYDEDQDELLAADWSAQEERD